MKKSNWLLLGIILSTFLIGILLYPKLPDKIPLHWNLSGEVDNYGGKFFGTFLIPALNLLMFFFFLFLPKVDPRKDNYSKFGSAYTIFRWAMHIFLSIMFIVIMIQTLMGANNVPWYLKISFLIPLFVSIMFIIIGNYLGKIKDNFFIGIRTPWTLSSKEVWHKTHRLTSKLYVISGLLGIIGSFFTDIVSFIMLIGPILLSTAISIIYSYVLFQREQNNK